MWRDKGKSKRRERKEKVWRDTGQKRIREERGGIK